MRLLKAGPVPPIRHAACLDQPRMDLPSYVQIEPVGQCNLRCQMCPIQFRHEGRGAFIEYELFTSILDDLPTVRELHLQGLGEPMMHPRFFDMVAYATARRIKVSTNTNATLLTATRAEQCITSGLAELHASLDAATAERYERIRVGASFSRVIRNLDRLSATKARNNSVTPRIRLVVVAMRQNIDELPALIRLAHDLGIESVFVQHLCHDFGEATLPAQYAAMRAFVAEQTLTTDAPSHVSSAFAAARDEATRCDVDLRLPRVVPRAHPAGTPGPERCDWPWHGPYIAYDGHVMPCCMIATPDRGALGRVGRGESISRVWSGAAYDQFRAALASEGPPAICRSCAVYRGTF